MTFKTRPQVPMQDLKTPIAKYPRAETNPDSMKSISVCMFLFCFSLSTATAQTPSAKTVDATQNERIANGTVVPLWDKGAPGFEGRRNEPEKAESYWVANIHNPTITVFLPPAELANGTAVLIAPGGGHKELGFKGEGVEPAEFFNKLGVAAFALKYRLGNDKAIAGPKPYVTDVHARQDGHRAMRLIRSKAVEWGIDPNRIGIMGFSAGGQLAAMVVYDPKEGDPSSTDKVEQSSSKVNFQIQIYPGGGYIPEKIPSDAPPAFLLAAIDDKGPAKTLLGLAEKYRDAGRQVELHLFSQGGHAFNMGKRSKLITIKEWSNRMADWMNDSKLLGILPLD